MNDFLTDLNHLAVLRAAEKAVAAELKQLVVRLKEAVRDKYGADRVTRWEPNCGATVTWEPSRAPHWDVHDISAFTGWLVVNGHGDLVHRRIDIGDVGDVADCVVAYNTADNQEQATDLAHQIAAHLQVVKEPYKDAPDILVSEHGCLEDRGRMVTAFGEVVSGVRWVVPPRDKLVVYGGPALKEGMQGWVEILGVRWSDHD